MSSPATPTNLTAIGSLLVARLLVAGEKGESDSKIWKDLEPLLAHRWSGTALIDVLGRTLTQLRTAGLVTPLPGKTKKAAPKFILTEAGRRQGLVFLGIAQLKPKTTWAGLKKTYLPASALGLPASDDARFKALSSDPGFKAVLLKRQYQLPTAEVPKLDDALDALAWRLIGFEGVARKFDVKSVKTALFNRALGDGRATDFKKAATRLLAQSYRARRDDPKELRDAVVRDWIDRESGPIPSGGAEARPVPVLDQSGAGGVQGEGPSSPPAFDLPAFARRVQAAARGCTTGRFGDHKVFIVHVWRMLRSEPDFAGMDFPTFKAHLAEANNARLLDLSRADLVQAMDPEDVSLSEVHYLNATFHFVRI
jgi:hypothetical protein